MPRSVRYNCIECNKGVSGLLGSTTEVMGLCPQCYTKRMMEKAAEAEEAETAELLPYGKWPIEQPSPDMTVIDMPPAAYMTTTVAYGLNGETSLVIKNDQTGAQLVLQMYPAQLDKIVAALEGRDTT